MNYNKYEMIVCLSIFKQINLILFFFAELNKKTIAFILLND